MRLDLGKYYEASDGSIHGPMKLTNNQCYSQSELETLPFDIIRQVKFFSKPCGPIWGGDGSLISGGYPSKVFGVAPLKDDVRLVKKAFPPKMLQPSILAEYEANHHVPENVMESNAPTPKPYKTGTYFVGGAYGEVDGRYTVHIRPEGTQVDIVGIQLLRSNHTKKELKAIVDVLVDVISVMED